MPSIATTGTHHIRLTVTDIQKSRRFYEEVLGFPVAVESPGSPEDPSVRTDPFQLYGGVVFQASGILLGLRPVAAQSDRFDPDRVGLDHLSFSVSSRDDLVAAASRLDKAGIEHGEIIEMGDLGIVILSFDDPDGIQLELTAPF
ncbi:VOC family protein [Nocardia donostiensis]|uniref:Glyoxalase n=1 Tax=Nocardia donostiensis TaxID=1538463 RepID=A0A1V2TIG0_9NOCA|nr:VOC family protein [Nocardia donostiensis]ONM49292.1 glyoxalase [Nocardia donostiensis]OQS14812.1 glyoxalase [Nocardia donostiensis]OQS21815.1 glyoxalase [Nocardia donostiensis]